MDKAGITDVSPTEMSSVDEKNSNDVITGPDHNVEHGHLKDLEVDLTEILKDRDEIEGDYEADHSPFAEGRC